MCGIAGLVGVNVGRAANATRSESLVDSLRHRGPDDSGVYVDPGQAVLVHTRLAIIDLSPAGHQPMSACHGRYTIVFNGEIYNHAEIRASLETQGVVFAGRSDTEVLLHLYASQGSAMVQRLEGMFAFAIWDREQQTLFLARDPLGIKPLYYSARDGSLSFASEVRTLLATKLIRPVVDPQALHDYFLFGSVQEPQTLVQGVGTLPAGHTLLWKAGHIQLTHYWHPSYHADPVSQRQAVAMARRALEESVQRHLVSDVPVGMFLSGGIDSTALVALASRAKLGRLKTFCIAFEETQFDEGEAARKTAAHFGTEHHEWRMSASDGKELIEPYFDCMDQPSNDGFNTWCVSHFARRSGMKVVLSGLGGDELFGSYPSFKRIPRLHLAHRLAKKCGLAESRAGGKLGAITGQLARRYGGAASGLQWRRLTRYLASPGGDLAAYWAMRGFFTPDEASELVQEYCGIAPHRLDHSFDRDPLPQQPTVQDTVGYLETTRYMRNQLLRDSDVMSMAHGLELRVPLVDRKLFDTINRIPARIRYSPGKRLLLDAVPEVPAWIAGAPKRGFRFPFENWAKERWQDVFAELQRSTNVPLDSWYRKWTILSLDRFLKVNGIAVA